VSKLGSDCEELNRARTGVGVKSLVSWESLGEDEVCYGCGCDGMRGSRPDFNIFCEDWFCRCRVEASCLPMSWTWSLLSETGGFVGVSDQLRECGRWEIKMGSSVERERWPVGLHYFHMLLVY
jgi:hypothetical protein